jgi:hypothetical protein
MKTKMRLAVRRSVITYGLGAMLFSMAASGNVMAQTTPTGPTVTIPALTTADLTMDLTPVRDVYNMTISASLGIAGYRKAGVAAKKW